MDLFTTVSVFFVGGELLKAWTSTNLLHVPKVDNSSSFKQLSPISLCNFCNKVISKLLMMRLSPFLPLIISPEQCGFVKGRIINDNILLAQELFFLLEKKVKCSIIIIIIMKVDISKAYDSLR